MNSSILLHRPGGRTLLIILFAAALVLLGGCQSMNVKSDPEVLRLQAKAAQGEPEAAEKLAERYEKGVGVEKDAKKAADFYALAGLGYLKRKENSKAAAMGVMANTLDEQNARARELTRQLKDLLPSSAK